MTDYCKSLTFTKSGKTYVIRDVEAHNKINSLGAEVVKIQQDVADAGKVLVIGPDGNLIAKAIEIPNIEQYAKLTDIPDVSGLAKKDEVYTKDEVEALIPEIPSLDNLATKEELEAVENAIPSLDGYATTEQVEAVERAIPSLDGYAKLEDIPEGVDLTGYAKLTDMPSLEGYATEQYVNNAIAEIEIPEGGVTAEDVKQAVEDYLAENPTTGLTEEQAEAVNQLVDRIVDVEDILNLETTTHKEAHIISGERATVNSNSVFECYIIPNDNYQTIKATLSCGSGDAYAVVFYSKENSIIETYPLELNTTQKEYNFVVPEGTATIGLNNRMDTATASASATQLVFSTISGIKADITDIKNDMKADVQILNSNSLLNANTSLKESEGVVTGAGDWNIRYPLTTHLTKEENKFKIVFDENAGSNAAFWIQSYASKIRPFLNSEFKISFYMQNDQRISFILADSNIRYVDASTEERLVELYVTPIADTYGDSRIMFFTNTAGTVTIRDISITANVKNKNRITSLEAQVDKLSVTTNHPVNNVYLENLPVVTAKLGDLLHNKEGVVTIGFLGDSWTQGVTSDQRQTKGLNGYVKYVTRLLQDQYGYAGLGWFDFGYNNNTDCYCADDTKVRLTKSGATPTYLTKTAKCLGVNYSHTVLPNTSAYKIDLIDENYLADKAVIWFYNNSAFTVSVNGEAPVQVTADATSGWQSYTIENTIITSVEVKSTADGTIIFGIDFSWGNKGVKVNKLGNRGLRTGHMVDVNKANWIQGFQATKCDLINILMFTNDRTGNVAPATVVDNLKEVVNRINEACPLIDKCIITPSNTFSGTGNYSVAEYTDAIRDWCNGARLPMLSTYPVFGSVAQITEYNTFADAVHPNHKGCDMMAKYIYQKMFDFQPAIGNKGEGADISAIYNKVVVDTETVDIMSLPTTEIKAGYITEVDGDVAVNPAKVFYAYVFENDGYSKVKATVTWGNNNSGFTAINLYSSLTPSQASLINYVAPNRDTTKEYTLDVPDNCKLIAVSHRYASNNTHPQIIADKNIYEESGLLIDKIDEKINKDLFGESVEINLLGTLQSINGYRDRTGKVNTNEVLWQNFKFNNEDYDHIKAQIYVGSLTVNMDAISFWNGEPSEATYIGGLKSTVGSALNEIEGDIPAGTKIITLSNRLQSGEMTELKVSISGGALAKMQEDINTLLEAVIKERKVKDGLRIAIVGDSISTSTTNRCPEIKIESADVGVRLGGWISYHDALPMTLGGVEYTSADIGKYISFIPTAEDVGKSIGNEKIYNSASTTVWWEHLKNIGVDTINATWSSSSLSSHEKTSNALQTSYGWHDSQIRRCGKRVAGSMERLAPDIIIVYRGCNDMTHSPYAKLTKDYFNNVNWTYPTDDTVSGDYGYKEAASVWVSKIRKVYPEAQIVFATQNSFKRVNYSKFPVHNGLYTLPQFCEAIREIADFFGCQTVDFDKDGITYENCYPKYVSDSATIPTHPNSTGHKVMGMQAIRDLDRKLDLFNITPKNLKGLVDHHIIANLTNATINNEKTVYTGESFSATLVPEVGYTITGTTITMAGVDVTSTAWNQASKQINITNVTGDIFITNTVAQAETCNLTQTLANATSNYTSSKITKNDMTMINIIVNDGYTLDTIQVTMGGANITNTVCKKYNDGADITIPSVTGDVTITATTTSIGSGYKVLRSLAAPDTSSYINLGWSKFGNVDKLVTKVNALSYRNNQGFGAYGAIFVNMMDNHWKTGGSNDTGVEVVNGTDYNLVFKDLGVAKSTLEIYAGDDDSLTTVLGSSMRSNSSETVQFGLLGFPSSGNNYGCNTMPLYYSIAYGSNGSVVHRYLPVSKLESQEKGILDTVTNTFLPFSSYAGHE